MARKHKPISNGNATDLHGGFYPVRRNDSISPLKSFDRDHFIRNSNVLVAELSDDNFVLSSMYGNAESPKAAICEFSKKHVHIFSKHSTDFIMVFQLALSSSTIGASHLIPLNL